MFPSGHPDPSLPRTPDPEAADPICRALDPHQATLDLASDEPRGHRRQDKLDDGEKSRKREEGRESPLAVAQGFSAAARLKEEDDCLWRRPSRPEGDDTTRGLTYRVLALDFSVLSPVVPWEVDDIWRIYAGYFFILHIPLSFGGLGLVAKMLKCSSLDPMTTVISTVILQLVELSSALALLQYTAMPGNDIKAFFATKISTQNWGKETVIGFTVLMTLVSTVSILGDKLVGHEDAYDPILTGILSDSPTSKLLCFILYCVIAPLSEETMYRGFLLNGLSSSMKWHEAVVISSIAFSVAHLSGSSFIQLFVVGCITGSAYCRTGTLAASFTIHSLYNAVLLYMVAVS